MSTWSAALTTKNGCGTRLRLRCGIGSVPLGPTGNSSYEPDAAAASLNTLSVFLRSSAILPPLSRRPGGLDVGARAIGQLGELRVAPPAHQLGGEARLRLAALATLARLDVERVGGVGVEAH